MPELPEVETVKNTLKNLIINKTIADISIYYPYIIKNVSVNEFINLLKNQTFHDIKRKGKYLIFILTNTILVSHLRMEGKFFSKKNEDVEKHEHIIFTFTDGTTLRYHDTRKFGTMNVFSTTNINDVLNSEPLNKIGFDPFEESLSIDELYDKFQKSTRPIKNTIMDQTIISGIGNIYADEILFMSRINPLTPTKVLTKDNIKNIIDNAKVVLEKAISFGGTTIRSFMSTHEISGKFQNELLVHTKEICPICHHEIIKTRVGGRGTYFCEFCQKRLDKEI